MLYTPDCTNCSMASLDTFEGFIAPVNEVYPWVCEDCVRTYMMENDMSKKSENKKGDV